MSITFAHPSRAEEKNDLVDKARRELSTKDRGEILSKGLFYFYRNFGDPRLTDLAQAVWDLDRTKYPDLSWDLLAKPEFRINFAQLWAQWLRKTKEDEKSVAAIRSYVMPYIANASPDLRAAAVNFLGSLGNESDIPLLVNIALNDDKVVAWNAVSAIAQIGGEKGKSALEDLSHKVKDPWVRDRIKALTINR